MYVSNVLPRPVPAPYFEHLEAVTIRNDVNLGKFLVSFTSDASVAGRRRLSFNMMKESLLQPVTVHFQQGLGQKFRQTSGSGIDFSMFEETQLLKEDVMDMYPLAVKAESTPVDQNGTDGNPTPGAMNSQITQAVFEKKKDEFRVRVVKQILWLNGMRYEIQGIYRVKECVICLSEPRNTTALPCLHMCMCSGCAKVLMFQTNSCPICGQPVERFLEISGSMGPDDRKSR